MELIFGTIAALLPIVNPFSTAPMFLSLTEGYADAERNNQAKKGVVYMTAILLVFLVAGTFIMNFFGLSLPGMRIAGGILVSGVGMGMLKPKDSHHTKAEAKEAAEKRDISFTPLAMPSLSGPGAISVVIGMSSIAKGAWLDYVYIALGILVVATIVFFTLRSSTRLVKLLGVNGLHAMTKIMGFIILCVGVQFIVTGVLGVLTGDQIKDFIQSFEK
ncbi:MAG: MarC family NAAT transporter [Chitinophagaceae bacterium]|nr:MarC family NAAT transporter [Chitinophagaceae bacterium]MCW5926553.1 MarC family NAAT transporter [Chitinophagaceae bacterium]